MKVCFVTADTLSCVWQEKLNQVNGNDVVVFSFNGMGLVSYKKELSGETEYFQDLAKLSKQLSSVIICGCDTDTYGVFRHSGVIADKGKILGVTDMAHSVDESEFVAGGSFRVYDTSVGKIGIIIAEDLFFPEVPRTLALCDADIIICLFRKVDDFMPHIMLRSGAFCNGVAMGLCAGNYACLTNVKGNVILAGSGDILKTSIGIEKDYHLISSRRRGLYREFNSGY